MLWVNASYIIVAFFDGRFEVRTTDSELKAFYVHDEHYNSACIFESKNEIWFASKSGIFKAKLETELLPIRFPIDFANHVVNCSETRKPDDFTIAGITDYGVFLIDWEKQAVSADLPQSKDEALTSCTMSPDGTLLGVGTELGDIRLFEVTTSPTSLKFLYNIKISSQRVEKKTFCPMCYWSATFTSKALELVDLEKKKNKSVETNSGKSIVSYCWLRAAAAVCGYEDGTYGIVTVDDNDWKYPTEASEETWESTAWGNATEEADWSNAPEADWGTTNNASWES
jgi:hypothetical protein